MFGNVVTLAFQNVFHAEMHQNDVFFIFKKLSLEIKTSKRFKT